MFHNIDMNHVRNDDQLVPVLMQLETCITATDKRVAIDEKRVSGVYAIHYRLNTDLGQMPTVVIPDVVHGPPQRKLIDCLEPRYRLTVLLFHRIFATQYPTLAHWVASYFHTNSALPANLYYTMFEVVRTANLVGEFMDYNKNPQLPWDVEIAYLESHPLYIHWFTHLTLMKG